STSWRRAGLPVEIASGEETHAAAAVPERRRVMCQLPVRLHDPRKARGRRRARRPGRRVPRGGGRDRGTYRRGVRDTRASGPCLRLAGARRADRCDALPPGRQRCRVRARRARGRREGRARQHGRQSARHAGARPRSPCLHGCGPASRRRGAVARLQRGFASDRRRRASRPARCWGCPRSGAAPAREPGAVARAARLGRALPEPLRRLRLWPRSFREPLLLDRLRARSQRAALGRRPGRICRRGACRRSAEARRAGADRRSKPLRRRGRARVSVQLGLRANARQFALLVGLNALVGGMVGLERSVLPLVGKHDFGLSSNAAILAFVVAFGAAKALTNLAAGDVAERVGRKRLLVIGWLVALPVPLLIGLAPSWWFIVAANVLLGMNQGLAWSMTVVMKIDLAGPHRRGLALGLNEAAGYLGVAATAFATGVLAASFAPRTIVWVGAALILTAGLLISVFLVRDTGAHVAHEQAAHGDESQTQLKLGGA